MPKITAKTKLCGVIGDPIEHSMSPLIQNAAFAEARLDYVYTAFSVKAEELEAAVRGMRALNLAGLNVTIPHKVAVMQYLNKTDKMAERIGAVNTIVNQDGVLTGHNTDAAGFLQALLETGFMPKDKNVIILGAGGAARGISFILAQQGAGLTIFNRTPEKAVELRSNIKRYFRTDIEAPPFDRPNLKKALAAADLLVNATSVGMTHGKASVKQTPPAPAPKVALKRGKWAATADQPLWPTISHQTEPLSFGEYEPFADAESPVPAGLLHPKLVVYDIVYNPVETALLKAARKIGARTISGVDMLVWQGALAFEKWTGHPAPVERMRKELVKALQT